eukprot:EG_transcript_33523
MAIRGTPEAGEEQWWLERCKSDEECVAATGSPAAQCEGFFQRHCRGKLDRPQLHALLVELQAMEPRPRPGSCPRRRPAEAAEAEGAEWWRRRCGSAAACLRQTGHLPPRCEEFYRRHCAGRMDRATLYDILTLQQQRATGNASSAPPQAGAGVVPCVQGALHDRTNRRPPPLGAKAAHGPPTPPSPSRR